MKTILYAAIVLACSTAFADETHTRGSFIDNAGLYTADSDTPYDTFDPTHNIELVYSTGSHGDHIIAETLAGNLDNTYADVRVYYQGLQVEAGIDGTCNGFTSGTHFSFQDMKIYQGILLIAPPNGNPDENTTIQFDGGHLVLNETHVDSDVRSTTVSIIGIDLVFDSGERHMFGYASAGVDCPVPVDLQSFMVD